MFACAAASVPHPAPGLPVTDEHRLSTPLDRHRLALLDAGQVHLQGRHGKHIGCGLQRREWRAGWGWRWEEGGRAGRHMRARAAVAQPAAWGCVTCRRDASACGHAAAGRGARPHERPPPARWFAAWGTHRHAENELQGQQARRRGIEEPATRRDERGGPGGVLTGRQALVVGLVVPAARAERRCCGGGGAAS
jgi:hypothetical protein